MNAVSYCVDIMDILNYIWNLSLLYMKQHRGINIPNALFLGVHKLGSACAHWCDFLIMCAVVMLSLSVLLQLSYGFHLSGLLLNLTSVWAAEATETRPYYAPLILCNLRDERHQPWIYVEKQCWEKNCVANKRKICKEMDVNQGLLRKSWAHQNYAFETIRKNMIHDELDSPDLILAQEIGLLSEFWLLLADLGTLTQSYSQNVMRSLLVDTSWLRKVGGSSSGYRIQFFHGNKWRLTQAAQWQISSQKREIMPTIP